MRRLPRRYLTVLVAALVAVLVGTVGPLALGLNGSAKDRIAADPPPALFGDATVAPLGRHVDAQAAKAHTLMRQWWSGHGRAAHDAAFTAWVERTLPGPPSSAQRTSEVDDVVALARTRTPAGVRASTWLEGYGKKDVWKLYAHDQAEVLPAAQGDARKQVCPCSYPSRHAAAGAAATTYLSSVDPHRVGEYRWMQSEIDYSRVYMAGHTLSDVTGGALLGDMIGEYFAVTRGT